MNDDSLLDLEFEIIGGDFNQAGRVSTRLKSILKEVGFNPQVVRRVAISTYEAEMNVVMYARRGVLRFKASPQRISIVIEDEGQGIENIEMAMKEGYSTATDEMREMGFGAGMGLPNIKRNSDRFEITSEIGKGTRLKVTIIAGDGTRS
ncbi:MAG: anti-sigma regulatory factor [candidate division Zixibacteria bacterium DG_27]|nr:MAG: anti-sigma regulatory factor [candidate division Zixibacteria bacterium DG_27]